jgi:pantoate--beta-alanine ligase
MRTIRTVADVRAALAADRASGRSIALVPTMGALHEGHLSLIRAARAAHDVVVVSLFVNPAQFNEGRDLAAYPRDEARDAELAADAGADLLFAPADGEVYPEGFATQVRIRGPLSESLEGAHRGAGHFDGVATVVTKLFTIVAPDAAYFGAKDAQQLRVIRRLARDLNLSVEIVGCPTVRDRDGLALSSRNERLDGDGRRRALGLSRALREVADGIERGRFGSREAAEAAGLTVIRDHGAEPEYFCLVQPDTLAPAGEIAGELLLVTAARVGDVRLIDNLEVHAAAQAERASDPANTEAVPCSA